jgi:putative endonuclease
MRRRGFEVVGAGFTARRGELDLICMSGAELVVVEVKTRTNTWSEVHPADAVDDRKRRALLAATAEYRALTQWRGKIRFAVVSVLVDEERSVTSTELLEDPFG